MVIYVKDGRCIWISTHIESRLCTRMVLTGRVDSRAVTPEAGRQRSTRAMIEDNPYSPPQTVSPPMLEPVDGSWLSNGNAIHVVLFVTGLTLGLLSRFLRPFITGPIHFEALIEFGVKIAISIAMLWLARNRHMRHPVLRFSLSVFALWIGSAIGWSMLNGRLWSDHLLFNTTGCLITLGLGATWIWLTAKRSRLLNQRS